MDPLQQQQQQVCRNTNKQSHSSRTQAAQHMAVLQAVVACACCSQRGVWQLQLQQLHMAVALQHSSSAVNTSCVSGNKHHSYELY
jgi:hypothetical protein